MKYLFFMLSILITSCSYKEEVFVPVEPIYPRLKVYELNQTYEIEAYNRDNYVCIDTWKACLPKNEFKLLHSYTSYLRYVIKLYREQTVIYNKHYGDNNDRTDDTSK
ncbi:hypothetical protein ThvES_00019640 [Thiovulum sp. ES]|nr:hypothetical protein ThvES_00019640 [Thiovulum sp. ES]